MNFWKLLAVAAIVFEAGISGSWLAEQMKDPLPYLFGFYGAAVQATATFGGIHVAQQGARRGYVVAGLSGLAGVAFSFMFFGGVHNFLIALIMGIFPTGVAILAGTIESSQAVISERKQIEKEEREFERLRKLGLDKMKHAERIESKRVKTLSKDEIRLSTSESVVKVDESALSENESIFASKKEHALHLAKTGKSKKEIAEIIGVTRQMVGQYLKAA